MCRLRYHRWVMCIDYHVHTGFSSDCSVPMAEQCEAAVRAGIGEIAFTEHEDSNPKDYLPNSFDHPKYFDELARCRRHYAGKLVIRAAIEVSEPHVYTDVAQRILGAHPWDFVLGSLHWLDADTNTTNPDDFFGKFDDWRDAFRAYFREMLHMASRGDFDVLAHMDYPARYGRRYYGDAYNIGEYEPEIRAVLSALIERGRGIEINTSSLRRGMPAPCPPQAVVNWYHDMGGTLLTVGSDAHRVQDVGAGVTTALHMARAAGFTRVTVYERRKPVWVEIADCAVTDL